MSVAPEINQTLYTAEELLRLPDDGFRYELIRGELRKLPLPGAKHGSATSRLGGRIVVFVEDNALGECFTSETGFVIEHDPDTVHAPDWAFVSKERLPAALPEGYLPLAPDLVVETCAPNDSRRRVAAKISDWLRAGVKMAWELDPKAHVVTVYRFGREPRILTVEDTLDGEEILPGFTFPIRRLFRDAA